MYLAYLAYLEYLADPVYPADPVYLVYPVYLAALVYPVYLEYLARTSDSNMSVMCLVLDLCCVPIYIHTNHLDRIRHHQQHNLYHQPKPLCSLILYLEYLADPVYLEYLECLAVLGYLVDLGYLVYLVYLVYPVYLADLEYLAALEYLVYPVCLAGLEYPVYLEYLARTSGSNMLVMCLVLDLCYAPVYIHTNHLGNIQHHQ